MTQHRLIQELVASNVSDEEVHELFKDLQAIYENPFEKALNEAIFRGCNYVEVPQARLN